jgi:predicted lactoylglutathione lyase
MTPRLSIVTLGVADLARARGFYEALGFERSPASEDSICFYPTAGSVLALFGRAELAEDAGIDAEGAGFRAVTLAMNLDSEAEVDATWQRWVDLGGTPVKRPARVVWGGYSSYVADLDRHLWEIAYNPFVTFDEAGFMRFGL